LLGWFFIYFILFYFTGYHTPSFCTLFSSINAILIIYIYKDETILPKIPAAPLQLGSLIFPPLKKIGGCHL